MEIGLREILIIVGAFVIAVILLDGFRRARESKRNSLSLKIDSGYFPEGGDDFSGELPSGGNARRIDHDEVLGLSAGADYESELDFEALSSRTTEEMQPEMFSADQAASLESEREQDVESNATADSESVTDVIVINLLASNEPIQGQRLLKYLVAAGLRFGDMQIFHRHEQASGQGPIIFSMANLVKPGIFELEKLEQFSTPGISFFLSLPGPRNNMISFETMLKTCAKLARELDCELKDENQSALTQQTIEHYRYRISEFERRQESQAEALVD
ncbi:MAG: cell division protein ZipA [Gammaproteobacteria bacterium]|nr:MAG: cell division protein ZipA [Gammaproteobacteria bacterium]